MDSPARPSSPQLRADLTLVLLTAFWGSTFLVVKDALSAADPLSFLTLRFGIGALALSALARRSSFNRDLLRAGGVLGLCLFLGFLTQTMGLLFTTASRSAFITGLSVVLVPFVSIFLLNKWPSPPSLLGVLLAVLGLFWLTGGGLSSETSAKMLKGDALTVLCAVAYSFHITLTERFAARFPPVPLVTVQLWTVTLLSAVCIPWFHPHLELSRGLLGAVAFCGLFASAGAILGQTWAQARTTAVRAALIYSLEPVFAALFSVLTGREQLGVRELGGGTLIVLGVLTAEVGGSLWRKRREPVFRS